jgi:uncharacterized protein
MKMASMGKIKNNWKTVVVAFGAFVVLCYGYFIEPYWIEVTHHESNAGMGKIGIRVVQISDLHLQEIGKRELAVIDVLKELHPDVVVFTGDVIDRAESLKIFQEFLSSLPSIHRVGVLGNWEYWSDADLQELKSIYEGNKGSRLLVNESVQYEIKGKSVQVVGLDDFTAGYPSLSISPRAAAVDVSIFLEHSPGFFDTSDFKNLKPNQFDFCLSGHTHAGQVTLFSFALWTPRGSGHYKRGLYETSACPLYVSRGVGTSLVGMRLGARPEVAVFDF